MFTVMKSEKTKAWNGQTGPRTYEQKGVAEYGTFDAAMAACDKANRELKDRHYVRRLARYLSQQPTVEIRDHQMPDSRLA
jgi:hypothetical protein